MKHTPGPWKVGSKYPTDIYADRAGHAIARTCNPQVDGECEANAKLIAAAPELLVALEGAMQALYYFRYDHHTAKGTMLSCERLSIAISAIDKARNGS